MDFEAGKIYTGKVTGLAKFGAFVQLAPGKSGLVHISEIANTYVKSVEDHLSVGQEVSVKVLSIDDNGRINLSISKAQPQEEQPRRNDRPRTGYQNRGSENRTVSKPQTQEQQPVPAAAEPSADASFEQKLKQFMQASDSKMSGSKLYEKQRSSRRGGKR